MRNFVCLILALSLPAAIAGQSKPDRQSRRETCIADLSSFAVDPSTVKPPLLPDDLNGIVINYFESGCFGNCPAFTMRIQKNKVEWDGHAYVRKKGKAEKPISSEEFKTLVQVWLGAKIYAMRDDYCQPTCADGTVIIVTDVQDTALRLDAPGYSKKVSECFTTIDGKPRTPKPPDEYFQFSRQLVAFAKSKHWL
jgi:hypothetical protein